MSNLAFTDSSTPMQKMSEISIGAPPLLDLAIDAEQIEMAFTLLQGSRPWKALCRPFRAHKYV
jgi:hypothetical protein